MKIPKTIHYCWFGGKKKPKDVRRCIASWRKYCPDFEIIEWNESNFDIGICDYVREAYEEKRWAFVADYARCYIVNKYGGVYFDTDVELIRPINKLLGYDAFFASEDNNYINTGIGFGSKRSNMLLDAIISDYNKINFRKVDGRVDLLPCPVRNTKIIRSFYPNIDFSKPVVVDDMIFLSSEYFCPIDYKTKAMNFTENTYGIHWFFESWKKPSERVKYRLKEFVKRLVEKQ